MNAPAHAAPASASTTLGEFLHLARLLRISPWPPAELVALGFITAALEALADQNIPFTVKGKATYEDQVATLRPAPAATVKRRPRRPRRVAG